MKSCGIQSQFTNDTLKKFINNYRFDGGKSFPHMFEEPREKFQLVDTDTIECTRKFKQIIQGKLNELR